MKKKKKWILVVGSIFLLMVIIVSAFIGYRQYEKHLFSAERWKESSYVRKYMVEDLEKKYIIVGMSRNEIIKLLGEPWYNRNDHIGYKIGTTAPWYEKYMLLHDPYPMIRYWIYFDKNQIAIKTDIDQESDYGG